MAIQTIVGVGYAVDYLQGFGSRQIEAHNMANRNKMYTAMLPLKDEIDGFVIQSVPPTSAFSSMIFTFTLPSYINNDVFASQMKSEHGIELRTISHPTFANGIRVSLHLMNSEEDVDFMVNQFTRVIRDAAVAL